MENKNILRQIKDIQFQAEKILEEKPSLVDLINFGKYSIEINNFLRENIQIPEVHHLINEIVELDKDEIESRVKFRITEFYLPRFVKIWLRERWVIQSLLPDVRDARGKYASIEFLMKNYF